MPVYTILPPLPGPRDRPRPPSIATGQGGNFLPSFASSSSPSYFRKISPITHRPINCRRRRQQRRRRRISCQRGAHAHVHHEMRRRGGEQSVPKSRRQGCVKAPFHFLQERPSGLTYIAIKMISPTVRSVGLIVLF